MEPVYYYDCIIKVTFQKYSYRYLVLTQACTKPKPGSLKKPVRKWCQEQEKATGLPHQLERIVRSGERETDELLGYLAYCRRLL